MTIQVIGESYLDHSVHNPDKDIIVLKILDDGKHRDLTIVKNLNDSLWGFEMYSDYNYISRGIKSKSYSKVYRNFNLLPKKYQKILKNRRVINYV